MKYLFGLFLVFSIYSNENLEKPYSELKRILPENNYGWFYNEKQLTELFKKNKIQKIIEIGSWLGNSTMFFARNITADGIVYAIDHWQGSIENQEDKNRELLDNLYDQFLSNVIHNKLTKKIIPIKNSSYEASFKLDETVDLIYIDGAHDEKNVFQDIYFYYPKLNSGGIMCGDDWSWGGVRNAVRKFAKINNLELVYEDNFW